MLLPITLKKLITKKKKAIEYSLEKYAQLLCFGSVILVTSMLVLGFLSKSHKIYRWIENHNIKKGIQTGVRLFLMLLIGLLYLAANNLGPLNLLVIVAAIFGIWALVEGLLVLKAPVTHLHADFDIVNERRIRCAEELKKKAISEASLFNSQPKANTFFPINRDSVSDTEIQLDNSDRGDVYFSIQDSKI